MSTSTDTPNTQAPIINDPSPSLWERVTAMFRLNLDTNETATLEAIKRNIEFTGINLWALVFSSVIAAIGLYANHIPVLVGAMLISPLLSPMIGLGYGAGTMDFDMLKESLRSFVVMVVVGVSASFLYFLITPASEITPELLARVRPTLNDILISIAGGAIGIIAITRQDKMHALLGIGISAALLPSLCAIGFGLANFNLTFIFGASYVFAANALFIALTATFLVRLFQFPQKKFLDPEQEKRVKIGVSVAMVVALIPSLFTGWRVVQEAMFVRKATRFIEANIKFQNTTILKPYTLNYAASPSSIELILIGEPLADQVVQSIQEKLKSPEYGLLGAQLILRQSNSVHHSQSGITTTMAETIFREKDKTIEEQQKRINDLEKQLSKGNGGSSLSQQNLSQLSKKLSVIFPEISKFSYDEIMRIDLKNTGVEVVPTVLLDVQLILTEDTKNKIANYIKLELGVDKVEVIGY